MFRQSMTLFMPPNMPLFRKTSLQKDLHANNYVYQMMTGRKCLSLIVN